MKSILVDVDVTLADCSHRRHFVEKKPKVAFVINLTVVNYFASAKADR